MRGTVPPIEFIEIAEDRGLIVPIGAWVLEEACRQLVEFDRLRDDPSPPLTMAVNVSGRQLCAIGFVELVQDSCSGTAWPRRNCAWRSPRPR